jgi:hypothetical protein
VQAHHFGVTSDGVTAAAAIPEITFTGSKGAGLIAAYRIQSASSYDWSSYPPFTLTNSGAVWHEAVLPGSIYNPADTAGRVASGINHTAQANNDTKTFIAGALLGLAGGALLSAVQEALHASDLPLPGLHGPVRNCIWLVRPRATATDLFQAPPVEGGATQVEPSPPAVVGRRSRE